MLHIHLTAGDLLRTRFARQPAPLIEIGHAVAALQRQDPAFGRWRRSTAPRFPPAARLLLELIPPTAAGPLFIDPVTATLAEGLELVQAAAGPRAAGELRQTATWPTLWQRSLATGDRTAWGELDLALRLAHRHLIEGTWQRIWASFRAEVARGGRLLAQEGAQSAISALHPRITWNGTVMQIRAHKEMDVHPEGNGLVLLPSPLWTGRPTVTRSPDGTVVIVYPTATPLPCTGKATQPALAGVLGHTRAAILRLAATDRTTTELAHELKVSAATVSAHTKALRAAGLITTTRDGKAVLHSLTSLGEKLLWSTSQA